ncbi:MAG TPA: LLM class flavin-dependent oxidoreductase [Acidimicrobiales bacterium]|nr:LLM class flavin-dependent oxidoreductase [Acidimicrobiales bacterium]
MKFSAGLPGVMRYPPHAQPWRYAIGVGHAEREFDVLGVPFHERGAITDEHLAAMIELWTSDQPTFAGDHVAFDDIVFEPKPVQRPPPPGGPAILGEIRPEIA